MVQRKAPQRLGIQAEVKRSHVKLERQSSFNQQQDTRSRGGGAGGDLKKKMKKMERSIIAADLESLQGCSMMPKKITSPPPPKKKNYMKPTTSSSNARKERVQVTIHSQTATDKKNNSKNTKNLNSSKPLKSSLSRQSSLKAAIRSLMKRNLKGVVVNRATCSSTLKDSKFPKALDLSPGATEAEGTSVMRVCPYTFCSLNGHRHEPLPPLKCFMSARRQLIKTQKSMKLKGMSPFKVKVVGKDKKKLDTGQTAIGCCSPTEEVSEEYFIEIYTSKPEEEIKVIGDDWGHVDGEIRDDEYPNDSYSDVSYEDGTIDKSSELSDEDMDVMMDFLEYVEFDEQAEEAKEENLDVLQEECVLLHDENCLVELSVKVSEDMAAESENKVSALDCGCEEVAESTFPENETESLCSDEDFGLASLYSDFFVEQAIYLNLCDVAGADVKLPQEVNQEEAEDDIAMSFSDKLFIDPITPNAYTELLQEMNDKVADSGDALGLDGGSQGGNVVDSDEGEELSGGDVSDQASKLDAPGEDNETKHDLSEEDDDENGIQEILANMGIEEEAANEVKGTSPLSIVPLSDSLAAFTEVDHGTEEGDHIQAKAESQDFEYDGETECTNCLDNVQDSVFDDESGDTTERLEELMNEQQEKVTNPEGSIDKTKLGMRIIRRKMTEDLEEMKEFNPRGPNFLSLEPDPDAEHVDLRHQTMDERKNSEEWMIDYALRRKLAPVPKKKVAVLVEAFETVMPPPVRKKPLKQASSGFPHARIIQACN